MRHGNRAEGSANADRGVDAPSRPTVDSPAGIRRRALAYLLDLALVGGVVVAVVVRLRGSRERRAILGSLLAVLGGTVYHVVLEGRTGRTAGKAIAGLTVVREDGTPCTYGAAAIRTALRVVDWLPIAYLLGALAIRLSERRQRIGDMAAGTIVVSSRENDRS